MTTDEQIQTIAACKIAAHKTIRDLEAALGVATAFSCTVRALGLYNELAHIEQDLKAQAEVEV
jgi:hypothetical protein